jgi:nucleoside permease NupC
VLRWSVGRAALEALTNGVNAVISSSNAGIQFLFGPLIPDPKEGVVFALQVLPVIIFFASLMSVLYYLRVMQLVIRLVGGGLRRLFQTSNAESTSAAANIFVGQTEGFLVIRPYINRMTRSELFSVMTVGMATVAGSPGGGKRSPTAERGAPAVHSPTREERGARGRCDGGGGAPSHQHLRRRRPRGRGGAADRGHRGRC